MSTKNLTQFLIDNPITDEVTEVIVSERLKGFPFKIKAMSGPEFNSYQKQCTTTGKRGKVDFNSARFHELVVLNHTVEPNFRDAQSVEAAGCKTPEQFLYRSLKAGEIIELAERISELSGFTEDDNKHLLEEAKN